MAIQVTAVQQESCEQRLKRVSEVLDSTRDMLHNRVVSPSIPDWCSRRGWENFLLSMDDAGLARCERDGLAFAIDSFPDAPTDLVELASRVKELIYVQPANTVLPGDALTIDNQNDGGAKDVEKVSNLRKATPRKCTQVSALLDICQNVILAPTAPVADSGAKRFHCARVVDVGAGQGHLTTSVAEHLGVPGVGIERNAAVAAEAQRLADIRRANSMAGDGGEAGAGAGASMTSFVVQETCSEQLHFASDDLVLGLHACGCLGDDIVKTVARDKSALLLVNCCLQKVAKGCDDRVPISATGQTLNLSIPKNLLGLTNALSRHALVDFDQEKIMQGREARYALALLLKRRGVDLEDGAEIRGIDRRWALRPGGLTKLCEIALKKRGLEPLQSVEPGAAVDDDGDGNGTSQIEPYEVAAVRAQASIDFPRMRRLSLPRMMLGRLLEMSVVLDRATMLEEAGLSVQLRAVFPAEISPRNIGIVATPIDTNADAPVS